MNEDKPEVVSWKLTAADGTTTVLPVGGTLPTGLIPGVRYYLSPMSNDVLTGFGSEPNQWWYMLILERVQTGEGLDSAQRADFRHHTGLKLELPLEQWIEMGRPNTVEITFTDGGAHAPVGA